VARAAGNDTRWQPCSAPRRAELCPNADIHSSVTRLPPAACHSTSLYTHHKQAAYYHREVGLTSTKL